jgi:hypothetical protein
MANKKHIPFDDAPEHAAALGRLIAHWNVLERILVIILQWLLGTSWNKALFIYQEFVSAKSKINLLRRLNHHFNKNIELKNEIDSYLGRASKLNSQRNQFIHALWGVRVEDKLVRGTTMEPPNYKKSSISGHIPEQFTSQDIQAVVEEIAELSQSLSDMIARIGAIPAINVNPFPSKCD